MRALVAALLIALLAAPARAQEEPVPTPDPPAAAEAPASAAQTLPPDDASPPEYDAAFAALARGDRAEARRQLALVVALRGVDDPWGRRAADLLRVLGGSGPAPHVAAGGADDLRHESPTRGARAELALFQTVAGIFAGVDTCIAIACDDPVAGAFLALAGGGLGLGASLAATRDGIQPGHMDLIDSGTSWGIWHGAALVAILDVDSVQRVGGGLLLGQGAGTALGMALWPVLRPTAGQMALANTVGGWSLALTLFSHGAFFDFDFGADDILGSLIVAGDVGLVAGAALASKVTTSRGHMLLIDAGGVLGALAGTGTAVLIEGDSISRETYFRSIIPGALVGLGAAAWFTRHWDAPDVGADVSIIPVPGGGAAAVVGGRF